MAILGKKKSPKTVDQVLSVFNTAIAELDEIQVAQDKTLESMDLEIEILLAKKRLAIAERDSALAASSSIKKLLSGEVK